jgi:phosphoribosyl-ATP pyrophosphohydrolase
VDHVAGKVTEEAAEVVDAAATRTPEALAEEAADLVYLLLALLRMKGVAWADVLCVLRARRASHGRGAKD